jgi:hypothetical protein
MKKLLILLLLIPVDLFAPKYGAVPILSHEPINPYEKIIKAVTIVESAEGKYLYNPAEEAIGWFQVRKIRLDDYNFRTGESITHEECYDYEVGRKIFLYYISQIDYRDIKAIAINWNGVSERNLYYKKLKATLKTLP